MNYSSAHNDSQRALELLKKFQGKLADGCEKSLKISIDRLINVLDSSFFKSLIDIQIYYRELLTENASNIPTTDDGKDDNPNEANSAPFVDDDDEWQYLEIMLSRRPNEGFGFIISGGYDAPQENGDPSVFITRLAPGGVADIDDRLRPFDQILSVNDVDLTCVSNLEATQIFRDCGDSISLVIRRFKRTESNSEMAYPITNKRDSRPSEGALSEQNEAYWYEVNLVKPSEQTGLGFSIAGGQSTNDDTTSERIIVTRISPGGLAEVEGQIQPGDHLMQVNGVDIGNATHVEAVNLLRNAGANVHLVLCRMLSTVGGSDISMLSKSTARNVHISQTFASPSSSVTYPPPPPIPNSDMAPIAAHRDPRPKSIGHYKKR